MTTLEPVWLPPEIAAHLHVSERTLRRLKDLRLIRIVRISARRWGMRPSDIAAYVDSVGEGGDGTEPVRARVTSRHRPGRGSGNVVRFTDLQKAPP